MGRPSGSGASSTRRPSIVSQSWVATIATSPATCLHFRTASCVSHLIPSCPPEVDRLSADHHRPPRSLERKIGRRVKADVVLGEFQHAPPRVLQAQEFLLVVEEDPSPPGREQRVAA